MKKKRKLHIFYKSRAHVRVTLLHTNNAQTAEILITNWSRSSADFKTFKSLSNESLDMCTENMSIFSKRAPPFSAYFAAAPQFH